MSDEEGSHWIVLSLPLLRYHQGPVFHGLIDSPDQFDIVLPVFYLDNGESGLTKIEYYVAPITGYKEKLRFPWFLGVQVEDGRIIGHIVLKQPVDFTFTLASPAFLKL